jgi:general secretion pathway protein H
MTSRSDAAGFTLIELLVALAVLALALGLAGSYMRAPTSTQLGFTASDIAGALRLARAKAVAHNRPVAVAFDLASSRWRNGDGEWQRLPGGIGAALLAGRSAGASGNNIVFYPDGSSSGGRITLAQRDRQLAVGVDWLSGRVSIAELR